MGLGPHRGHGQFRAFQNRFPGAVFWKFRRRLVRQNRGRKIFPTLAPIRFAWPRRRSAGAKLFARGCGGNYDEAFERQSVEHWMKSGQRGT